MAWLPPRGRRRRAFSVVLCVVLMGAAASAIAASPVCGAAPPGSDATPTATIADASVDVDALCAALQRIATPEANLHGVVVERGGRLRLEAYFDGFPNVKAFIAYLEELFPSPAPWDATITAHGRRG